MAQDRPVSIVCWDKDRFSSDDIIGQAEVRMRPPCNAVLDALCKVSISSQVFVPSAAGSGGAAVGGQVVVVCVCGLHVACMAQREQPHHGGAPGFGAGGGARAADGGHDYHAAAQRQGGRRAPRRKGHRAQVECLSLVRLFDTTCPGRTRD